jgi:hypothetical protein
MLVYQRVMFSAEVYGVNPVMVGRGVNNGRGSTRQNIPINRSLVRVTNPPVSRYPQYTFVQFLFGSWYIFIRCYKLNLPDNSVSLGIIAVNLISTPCPIYHRSHFYFIFFNVDHPGKLIPVVVNSYE